MTRLDHISYCSVCIHGQLTAKDGFTCGLTQKLADFKDSCPDFKVDVERKRSNLEKYRTEIDESIHGRDNWIKGLFSDKPILNYLIQKDSQMRSENNNQLLKEIVVSEQRSNKVVLLVLGLAMLYFVGKHFYTEFNPNDVGVVIVLASMVMWSIYMIYLFARSRELFRMNKQGLIIEKKEFIPWNRIDFMYFQMVRSKHNTEHYLILRENLAIGEDKRIHVSYANRNLTELGQLVYECIKK